MKLKIDVLKEDESQFQEEIGDLLVQKQLIENRIEHELPELEQSLKRIEHKLNLINCYEVTRS